MNRRKFLQTLTLSSGLLSGTCYKSTQVIEMFSKHFPTIESLAVKYADLSQADTSKKPSFIISEAEGIKRAEHLSKIVSGLLNYNVSPTEPLHYSNIRKLADAVLQQPYALFDLEYFKDDSRYVPGVGIFLDILSWQKDNFDSAYSHELFHKAHEDNDTRIKLARSAVKTIKKIRKSKYSAEVISRSSFSLYLCEGLARIVEEKASEIASFESNNSNIKRIACADVFQDVLPIYLGLLDVVKKPVNKKLEPYKDNDSLMTHPGFWEQHQIGTTMLQIMQTKDPLAYKKLFHADASPLEVLFN